MALDALFRSGLVHSETETTAEFVHQVFRQALYDDLAVSVRTRLHTRAFTASPHGDSDLRKSVNRTHSDVRFLFGMARRNLLKLR
jgi:hypothetical protein